MSTLGKKYVLGTWAVGSRVQLDAGDRTPGRWVTIIGNYADTTGVVVLECEVTKARFEKDGRHPLFEVDVLNAKRLHHNVEMKR